MQEALSPMKNMNSRFNEQLPVDTYVLTALRFDGGNLGDLLRMVITNDQRTTQCAPYTEYQHWNTSVSIEDVSSFMLRSTSMSPTQQAVDDFVDSMPHCATTAQAPSWTRGVYSPSAARKRLYKAIDPDDSTKWIGVVVEQDNEGHLVQLTWYKTTDAAALCQTTPAELNFELVRDGNGAPTLDPNYIGGWTWYYTA